MPELGPKDLSFIKELKDTTGLFGLDFPGPTLEAALVKKYNQEFIGSGEEVVVVGLEGSTEPHKVVAFNYKDVSPEKAKEIFYLHRLFSTLFPHNFPHFYASSGRNLNLSEDPSSLSESISGTIRQKIEKDKLNSEVRYPFKKVDIFCHELGILVLWDINQENFIVGVDGGQYYVDTLEHPMIREWDNIDNIVQYMEKNKYTPQEIEIVELSFKRLKEIAKNEVNTKI